MYQFGKTLYAGDHLVNQILEKFQREIEAPDSAVADLIELVRAASTPARSVLIYVRFLFWGYIPYARGYDDLCHLLSKDSFSRLSAFDRTEIATCLGPRLTANLAKISLGEARGYRRFDEACVTSLELRDVDIDEIWHYIPPPTGFFSIVENIVLARFVCTLRNKQFRLDDTYAKWWRYPVSFDTIFHNTFPHDGLASDKPVRSLTWDVVRQVAETFSPHILQLFANFKQKEYARIKQSLLEWLSDQENVWLPGCDSAIYFIRGGDKLVMETMPPPAYACEKDSELLYRLADDFYVLSDDNRLAQDYAKNNSSRGVINITETNRNGYFLNTVSSIEDVRTIVRNYLIMANVRHNMSCPSSNIVNSANWSNLILDDSLQLSSTPLVKYAYL